MSRSTSLPMPSTAPALLIYLYAFIGVTVFAFTLPMTRLAVQSFDPWLIGMARASIAGVFAAIILLATRSRRPTASEWRGIALSCTGVIVGWPVFSSIAMQTVPSSHGAVLSGLIPLATAIVASARSGEPLSRRFWMLSLLGAILVLLYAFYIGEGALQTGDIWLALAVFMSGVGYAEGGRVARTLGGWRTICWCLAASLPLTIPATLWLTFPMTEMPSSQSVMALLYLALFSSLLGFFPWYKAMAMGGVARIGQVQLAQPFLTVLISAVWLSEQVDLLTWLSCIVIIAIIAASRRA